MADRPDTLDWQVLGFLQKMPRSGTILPRPTRRAGRCGPRGSGSRPRSKCCCGSAMSLPTQTLHWATRSSPPNHPSTTSRHSRCPSSTSSRASGNSSATPPRSGRLESRLSVPRRPFTPASSGSSTWAGFLHHERGQEAHHRAAQTVAAGCGQRPAAARPRRLRSTLCVPIPRLGRPRPATASLRSGWKTGGCGCRGSWSAETQVASLPCVSPATP